MKVDAQVIEHFNQRYDTTGDWWFSPDFNCLHIRVSRLNDPRSEQAIILHEIAEAFLCLDNGIEEKDVMAFDLAFESKRVPGNLDEPGDDPDAPYKAQHKTATFIEQMFLIQAGLRWDDYEADVNNLPQWEKPGVH